MMDTLEHFEQQVQKGLAQELRGWDFTWLHAHTRSSQLPWDYRQIVLEHMKGVQSLLDAGTGGGEFLASLAPLPADTHATEGYAPNVPAARRRLEPLGVKIADVTGDDEHLPYPDRSFDLVIDRHNGCEPAEVYRVLRPGGLYITQQVGGENCMDLNRSCRSSLYTRTPTCSSMRTCASFRKRASPFYGPKKPSPSGPSWTLPGWSII